MSNNTKLICLFLKAQKTDKSSEQGYSMAMVSIITIILFSLVVAATILSNMAKARTNAFVDSNSAFYVAEAGLNKRAAEINKILKSYAGVRTVAGGPTVIGDCFQFGIPEGGSGISARSNDNDLECVNYRFQSSNNIARTISGSNIVSDSGGQDKNTYVAYTLVADRTNLVGGQPPFAVIPAGEPFGGLNATSFTYQVSSVGKKPVALPNTSGAATATAARESSNNVTLSMTFVNRVVPLFQFGIFYDGDLELNSSSDMQINGWVHSNANMYLLPSGIAGVNPTTTFMANVSAFGSIYNRVDAWTNSAENTVNPTTTTGISRLRLGTGPDDYRDIPAYSASTAPLDADQIKVFNDIRPGVLRDGAAGAARLTVPSPSFGRKRNYLLSANASAVDRKAAIAESFAKADMRLEMVPDRDVTSRVASPWTRSQAIIPFNFTAITTGGGNGSVACTTATPAANSDPAATYVDPERENVNTLRCNIFDKGKLQSLRQPVLVLTDINVRPGTIATPDFRALERQTLGAPTTFPTPPSLSLGANTNAVKARILRALQVAIASTPTPITLDNLADAFRGSAGGTYDSGDLLTCRTTFENLIGNITDLTPADITSLRNSSPNQIAALRNAWFLPAPIQRVEPANLANARNTNVDAADLTANNRRSSGFYDGREQRWMTMLQTNIASLAVWNRDGLFVPADGTLTNAYSPAAGAIDTTFGLGTGTTNNTNGLAFDRVTTFTNAGAEIYPVGSLQYLGLGARDTTEGGLVFHTTVNDNLDGNGTSDANDINFDNTMPIQARNDSGNLVTVDYVRTYPNQTNARQSPFAFAFNGGNYLLGAMTLASDQSIYVQGNYNNNDTTPVPNAATAPNASRLPAAILADTITVLSNQCVNNGANANPLGVPSGQLSCGVPPTINGNPQNYNNVGSALSINAAFLSNTQVSNGNLGAGRGFGVGTSTYSGGANNYIRLLENWFVGGTPFALNYYGSLVSLNQPIENSGPYRAGGLSVSGLPAYYDVPLRNVNFDTNFLVNTQLPPLTPKASYVRQSSFSRTY
jgi:hypothetical protein